MPGAPLKPVQGKVGRGTPRTVGSFLTGPSEIPRQPHVSGTRIIPHVEVINADIDEINTKEPEENRGDQQPLEPTGGALVRLRSRRWMRWR